MIDEFIAAVIADGGQAARVPDVAAARTHVAGLMGEERTLCFWDGDPLVLALDPASLGTVTPPPGAFAGITGAAFGVARTGTVVLTYGEGRSRATGLLPDLHVALLAAYLILPTLHEAIARVFAAEVPRAMTLVTGASATSDIEKIRVTGAHGPRRVAIVVIG
ncbi:MAG: L-lactate dehydrogenase complex protein LldG [Gaiellales bacterium]|nr:L-lactate dehydrogenase complex protein LldG [Gaiellales bacterium]